MRDLKLQEELNNMSVVEKRERVSIEAMKQRGAFIKEYVYRYLTNQEYRHDNRGITQLILWSKDNSPCALAMSEFGQIEQQFNHLEVTRHSVKDMSVEFKKHYHFYNLKH